MKSNLHPILNASPGAAILEMGGNMQTFLTYLPIIKDIVTILATATAAIVAIIGLQTWKRQITGKAEYDLARRVLIASYKVRDAFVENKLFFSERDNPEESKKKHERGIAKIDEAIANLNVELLEAKVVWGDDYNLKEIFDDFLVLPSSIKFMYETYYSINTSPEIKEYCRSILFTNYTLEEGLSQNGMERHIRKIEDFLRPKLRLNQGRIKGWQLWRTFKVRFRTIGHYLRVRWLTRRLEQGNSKKRLRGIIFKKKNR